MWEIILVVFFDVERFILIEDSTDTYAGLGL